ncbi:hypothetical protein ACUYGK_04365 [Enterobacter roggenkampii]|uniref:hypothetical protein n=1 Tax=Enterobacter TaxID=547 RepID=UPI000AC39386|nr:MULTISPECIES: hypothetical protein [Enterobacter]MDU7153483.1 hypothetical protein [Enterobacter sp.]
MCSVNARLSVCVKIVKSGSCEGRRRRPEHKIYRVLHSYYRHHLFIQYHPQSSIFACNSSCEYANGSSFVQFCPGNCIELNQRIEAAAAELGFDVQHESEEQLLILFRPDEETHSFYGKDRAAGALRFLRSELAYVATMHPDTPDDWSKTRLRALCLLDGEKL